MQNTELVEAVLSGDKRAQRAFYDDHVEQVYALSFRMTGDAPTARECTQVTFIRLFDRLHSFRGDAALSTWVHAVAVSVVLQWRRDTARRRQREVAVDSYEEFEDSRDYRGSAIDEAVCRAIDSLATAYQTVVVMHDIEGYTHEEIGAALGIAAGTSKVRLSRARAKLRALLVNETGELAYERG